MQYKPKGFADIPGSPRMAPSELQPPLNFADGGAVNWASDATIYNTQSQLGNLAATPGGFGGMAKQFTTESPFGGMSQQTPMSPLANQTSPMTGTMGSSLQPKPVPPATVPLANMPPASMAKGGKVENLITRLREEFSKR